MREISLHLTDIIENSTKANASLIELSVNENRMDNVLSIRIADNGCGMDSEMLVKVTDPFVTTRTTRKVGLGISLFKSACERCDGSFEITSELGKGTTIIAAMQYDHIDRAPLGKLEDMVITVLLTENVDLVYTHTVDRNEFIFDSREIKKIVGDELNSPEILMWLKEYLNENISNIGGGIL